MLEKNSQSSVVIFFFFFNDTATTEIYTLSLHDALPICAAIGDDSCLYPGVTVYPGCLIGARAIVHSGAVIGADGFGIAREGEGWVKIPQIGRGVIGDDVEIGADTTIDRGADRKSGV